MTAAQIIDTLGGAVFVSKALHLTSTTVGNWRARNSIPARYHHAVLSISEGKITADEIVAAHATMPEAAA